MKFKKGDVVRVIDIGTNGLSHPTENRRVINGDVLAILDALYDEGNQELIRFKVNGGAIFAHRVELVGETPTFDDLDSVVCKCPTLLNGHHPGCPFRKD